jgi:TPR repeat protein
MISEVIAVYVWAAGFCYEQGTGVTQNLGEAVRLYTLAADQGNAGAQNSLGKSVHHSDAEQWPRRCIFNVYRLFC